MVALKQDHYAVLGVSPTATPQEITQNYKKLALVRHPDREGGSTAAFQMLLTAYETLKDPVSRRNYNMTCFNLPGFERLRQNYIEKLKQTISEDSASRMKYSNQVEELNSRYYQQLEADIGDVRQAQPEDRRVPMELADDDFMQECRRRLHNTEMKGLRQDVAEAQSKLKFYDIRIRHVQMWLRLEQRFEIDADRRESLKQSLDEALGQLRAEAKRGRAKRERAFKAAAAEFAAEDRRRELERKLRPDLDKQMNERKARQDRARRDKQAKHDAEKERIMAMDEQARWMEERRRGRERKERAEAAALSGGYCFVNGQGTFKWDDDE